MKVPLCFYFCFLFRTNRKKEHFPDSSFHHCYGTYLIRHSYVQSSFLIITRYIDKMHLGDTLQLKILQINIHLISFSHCTKNFCFLFRTNRKKEHFPDSNFHHCYGTYLIRHSYVQSSFLTITRYIDKMHLGETLQVKILQIIIHLISFSHCTKNEVLN